MLKVLLLFFLIQHLCTTYSVLLHNQGSFSRSPPFAAGLSTIVYYAVKFKCWSVFETSMEIAGLI